MSFSYLPSVFDSQMTYSWLLHELSVLYWLPLLTHAQFLFMLVGSSTPLQVGNPQDTSVLSLWYRHCFSSSTSVIPTQKSSVLPARIGSFFDVCRTRVSTNLFLGSNILPGDREGGKIDWQNDCPSVKFFLVSRK